MTDRISIKKLQHALATVVENAPSADAVDECTIKMGITGVDGEIMTELDIVAVYFTVREIPGSDEQLPILMLVSKEANLMPVNESEDSFAKSTDLSSDRILH